MEDHIAFQMYNRRMTRSYQVTTHLDSYSLLQKTPLMSGLHLSDTGMDRGEKEAIPLFLRESMSNSSDEITLEVPARISTREPDGSLAIVGDDGGEGEGRRERTSDIAREERRTVRAQRIIERRHSISERPESIGHQESDIQSFEPEYHRYLEE